MTKSYQICIIICTGVFLLSWEIIALIFQGWTNKPWGTGLFAFLGGLILASGLVGIILWDVLSKKKNRLPAKEKNDPEETPTIEVTPIEGAADGSYVVEESKKRQERADFIFDVVNLSTATLTIIITVLFLNTFTTLWLRGYLHGYGYVRLEYGLGEGTLSLLITQSPMINFYNAKMSTENHIEYKHGWRKFCAAPIISESYSGRKKNYTGYWGRCMIDSGSDCTSSLKHECLLNFGNQLNLGRRTTEDEEKSLGTELQKLRISDNLPVVVDINDTEKQIKKSKRGLMFGLLNLVWLIPTLTAVLVLTAKKQD